MPTQLAIRRWFNRTYSAERLTYLRPPEFYSIFMEYLDVRPGERLLDVGCGPGLLLGQATSRGLAAYGVDVSESALAMVPEQAPGARAGLCNAEALCYRDGSFDYITCIGVFEHFLDPAGALGEMRRVLKPEGRICVMVPNSRTLRWKIEARRLRRAGDESNEQAATLEEWREVFAGNSLTIEAIHRDEWPRYQRRRRFLGHPQDGFAVYGTRSRHVLPLRYANQFVFLMRP